jgi:hypothetical protein
MLIVANVKPSAFMPHQAELGNRRFQTGVWEQDISETPALRYRLDRLIPTYMTNGILVFKRYL